MAEEKDVLLKFKIDTGTSVQSIEKLRAENRKLTQERNKVNISTEEGKKAVQELNQQIDKNTAIIKTNSSALEKQRLNVGNYSNSIQDAAKELKIAGVGVQDVSTKLAAFANPATAAVGILGALGAAYARSSTGAKDLEFAQNQLASTVTILTDRFASLFSSVEDGEGIVSKFVGGLITQFVGLEVGVQSSIAALASDKLNTILEEREIILADNAERLAENADLLVDLTDKTKSVSERQQAFNTIVENSKKNSDELVKSLKNEIIQINLRNVGVKDRGPIDLQIGKIQRQIRETQLKATREQATAQKALNAALKAEGDEAIRTAKASIDARSKQTKELEKYFETLQKGLLNLDEKEKEQTKSRQENAELSKKFLTDTNTDTLSAFQNINDRILKGVQQTEGQKRAQWTTSAELKKSLDQEQIASTELLLQNLLSSNKDFAALSIASIIYDRFKAGSQIVSNIGIANAAAVAASPLTAGMPWVAINTALGAASIASIIAEAATSISQIGGGGFAEGGYTGDGGKHEPAGIVHRGEYVIPKKIVQNPVYRPTIEGLEKTRLRGYADGGLVTNTSTSSSDQSVALMNAIKNMPRPVVDVRQVTREQRRVEVKQQISRT